MGNGKSVFLNQWAGELRKAQIPVVYFDAFAHDYQDDAFVALAAQIIGLAREAKEETARTVDKLVAGGKKIATLGLKFAVRAAAAVSTQGASELVGPALAKVGESAAAQAAAAAEGVIEKRLRSADEEKSTIDAFQSALSELPRALGSPDKPLVVIVDELDRCRPLFAVQLLERMKHVFAADRVHFVLGVNLSELAQVVRSIYGSGVNGEAYLQKFINLTVDITARDRRHSDDQLLRFARNRWATIVGGDSVSEEIQETAEWMHDLCIQLGLNLREMERAYSYLALAVAVRRQFSRGARFVISLGCVFKASRPEIYAKLIKKNLSQNEFNELMAGYIKQEGSNRRVSVFLDVWRWLLGMENKEIAQIFSGYGVHDQTDWVPIILGRHLESLRLVDLAAALPP